MTRNIQFQAIALTNTHLNTAFGPIRRTSIENIVLHLASTKIVFVLTRDR